MKKILAIIILVTTIFCIGCNSQKEKVDVPEVTPDIEKTEVDNTKQIMNETEYHKDNSIKEAKFINYVGATSIIDNKTFLRMTLVLDPTKELRIKRCVLNIKIGDTEKSVVYVPDTQKDEILIPENENERMLKIPDKTIYENIEYKVTNIEYK